MNDSRKGLLVALIVGVPLLFGIGLIALSHLARSGEEGSPRVPELQDAPAPVQTGTHVPRIMLQDARSGRRFDSDALSAAYGVVFISTECDRLAGALRTIADELRRDHSPAAILALSTSPRTDSLFRARTWLKRHREPPNFHFLLGAAPELQPYWSAWGFASTAGGGGATCEGVAPIHLVNAAGANAGVIDLDPDDPEPGVAEALEAMSG